MHATNITSTEAEIMSMHLGLEQALETVGIKKITIITNAIHGAQKLFDALCHLLSCRPVKFWLNK